MKIKASMKLHFIPPKIAYNLWVVREEKKISVDENVMILESLYSASKNIEWYATVEKSSFSKT